MPARVVVLAGPSGAGKSRLAERIGLPVLRLDDFYKSGTDASLPRIADGPNAGIVDWDHPDSWLHDEAVATVERLCAEGAADVPIYQIAQDGRTGWHFLDLEGAPLVVAEGIFAQEVVPELAARRLLAAAYCVRQHPLVTFWRRLLRDLREHRKPPLVLVRRGVALLRAQRKVVRHAQSLGCQAVTPRSGARRAPGPAMRTPGVWAEKLLRSQPRQPDRRSCGASSAVLARALHDESYARSLVDGEAGRGFREEVLQVHRRLTGALGVTGRVQLPWPRALGTPPWAVARALTSLGARYVIRWGRPRTRRTALYDRTVRAVTDGAPVALYVGNRELPRHVVLALPATAAADTTGLSCYEPSSGQVLTIDRAAFVAGGLNLGGWSVPWFVVLPQRY